MESDSSDGSIKVPNEKTTPVHPSYNDPDADVTFQSSDGVLFHLQRKYLEVATGAFPGAEFNTNGEVTALTESAAVLAVLFGFVHPKRYPDVDDLDFSLLAQVAEAAEKYEAFAGIELCRLQMRSFLPKYALEILIHAARHDCTKLVQQAIPHLGRHSLTKIACLLPSRYVLPWIRYHQAFESIFSNALTSILSLRIASPTTGSRPGVYFTRSLQSEVCHACMILMINNLEEMKSVEALEEVEKMLGKPKTGVRLCMSTSCQYSTAFEKICTEVKQEIKDLKFYP